MIRAAGILFVAATPQGRQALFLKRGAGGDHPGEWAFPGGKVEDGETAEQAAIRETEEECGVTVSPDQMREHLHTITQFDPAGPQAELLPPEGTSEAADSPGDGASAPGEDVDFVTYVVNLSSTFTPKLCDENTGYAWASLDDPPQPLLPGAALGLARLSMHELGVAQAMLPGPVRIVSPTRYENVWLFDMRVTGTGTAYRQGLEEFVWRAPELYLHDEFLARCNGLPVIMEHPEGSTLNSKEYNDRNVGSVYLPYIKGDEVWAIAKVWDDTAAKMIQEKGLSTSPSVVFKGTSGNSKMTLDDGKTLLIEGTPSLLDHLALCSAGVWDKGETPEGIVINDSAGERIVAEETEAEDKKSDSDLGSKLDGIATRLDSLHSRMDAMESSDRDDSDDEDEDREDADEDFGEDREDADEDFAEDEPVRPVADKRKDSRRKDSRRGDAGDEDEESVADAIKRVESMIPKRRSDEDEEKMSDAQAKADSVYAAHGKRAPRAMDGEGLNDYRKRLLKDMVGFSPAWKPVPLSAMADAVLDVAETQVYADALNAANNPVDIGAGNLVARVSTDETGRKITSYKGDPAAWMDQFSGYRSAVTHINNGSRA